AEVVGSEQGGGRDREELRVDAAVVLKPVDLPARHADRRAGTDLDRLAVDRPGRDTLEPVDRLLKAVVAVRRRHLRVRGDIALEYRRGPVRVSGLDQEADAERANRDAVVLCGLIHGDLLRVEPHLSKAT